MQKHILILGGGVVGLAAARRCAIDGHRVTLVDRLPAGRDGCSFGNAGMIVPSHFVPLAAPGMVALGMKWMLNPESPFYIKPRLDADLFSWAWGFWRAATRARVAAAEPILRDISLLSRNGYEALAADLDIGLVQKGLLMLCQTQHALAEESKTAARARELGIPAEILDAAGVARLEPGITMDVAGGVYFPLDCHLPPDRLLQALQQDVLARGVDCRWETEVTGWTIDDNRISAAQTPGGPIAADEFVLCAGVWSTALAKNLGIDLPMQAGKGYSLTLRTPRQLPEHCAILTEARVAVTPMGGALRVGGTMEVAGLNHEVSPRRVRGIVRSLCRYFPGFKEADFDGITPWHGLRPCSPDGMPYLGRSERYTNLICATGHAMMGLSLAPATADIIAGLAAGRPPALALDLFSPDRYQP